MMSFGILGTGFQSVIYNTLISEMYKVYTGKARASIGTDRIRTRTGASTGRAELAVLGIPEHRGRLGRDFY